MMREFHFCPHGIDQRSAICVTCAAIAAASQPKPRGCVCPPGSEATCKGWDCPRRAPPAALSGGTGIWP